MMISAQLFDRIVGMSGSLSAEPDRRPAVLPAGCRRVQEKREAARFSFGQRALICRDRGSKAGVWDTVMLRDISSKGIGFLCHDPMDVEDTFILKLSDREGQSVRIRCAIQRCEAGGIGGVAFRLGATFEQVIQEKMLNLNDDDGPGENLQNQQTSANLAMSAPGHRPEKHSGPASVLRVAGLLLRAVDPTSWMRKNDDYSSAS